MNMKNISVVLMVLSIILSMTTNAFTVLAADGLTKQDTVNAYDSTPKVAWPYDNDACIFIRKADDENVLDDTAVFQGNNVEVEKEDLIYFYANNISHDIVGIELLITNASGAIIYDSNGVLSIPTRRQLSFNFHIVPANVLIGECTIMYTVIKNNQLSETYQFLISTPEHYMPLEIKETKLFVSASKDSNIILNGIKGLIDFADKSLIDVISVKSASGKECYNTQNVPQISNMIQTEVNETISSGIILRTKYDTLNIPFTRDGLEYKYKLIIPQGLLMLENGLNEEHILNFEIDIDVEDYILNQFPENASVIMMDEETQIQPITIDIAKPCEIADDMKVFANQDSIEYNIFDERDYYRIFFDLEIESGKSYAISFEENTITLPNGAKNKRTIGIFFDTVLKGSVDVFDTTGFRDLTEQHWAYNYISELAQKGIISGYEDGTFKPEDYIMRGELAKLLSEAFNQKGTERSEYSDIENHWAKSYIESTQQFIPIRDKTELLFHPNEYATREEVAASIASLVDAPQDDIVSSPDNMTPFFDELDIREDLRTNVNFAVYLGIIYGYEGNVFKPHENITRSEIAAMICRSLEID